MIDLQAMVLDGALRCPDSVALVILIAGMLYLTQGFRFARFLLAATAASGGYVLGAGAANSFGLPADIVALTFAGILGLLAVSKLMYGTIISAVLIWALIGHWIAVKFGLPPSWLSGAVGVGGFIGGSLFWVARRLLPLLLTTLQGAAMVIVGFVGVAKTVAPSLAFTFTDWANNGFFLISLLMTMLTVLGVSLQSTAKEGDIRSGGGRGWNSDFA